ncbi:MAG: helix-turn-helix transcriptional regulator [Bacteroidota bacterium]
MASEQVEALLKLIRDTRKKRNMTQAQVAELLGLSQNGYKNIEIGNTDLKVDMLIQLMQILGIQNDIFNSKVPEPPATETASNLPQKIKSMEDLYGLLSGQLARKSDLDKQGKQLENLQNQMSELQKLLEKLLNKK